MKSIALRSALLAFSCAVFAPRAEAQCPTGWLYWSTSDHSQTEAGNGHCYSFTPVEGTWTEMEALSNTYGAHLASVLNQSEATLLYNNFEAGDGVQSRFFIGLTDQAQEGTYVWTNGDPVDYTKWWFGEPDNGGSNGNQDFSDFHGGYWYDVGPETIEYGVMELDPTSVAPEPASIVFTATGLIGIVAVGRRRQAKQQRAAALASR